MEPLERKIYLIVESDEYGVRRNCEAYLNKIAAKRRVDKLNQLVSKDVEEPDYLYSIESLEISEDYFSGDEDDLK